MPIAAPTSNGARTQANATTGNAASNAAAGTPNVTVAATNASWAATMLGELGGPTFQTQNNINNVLSWMAYEEPPTSWWNNNNPLNLTVNGNTAANSTFPSLSASAAAVANQLKSPDYGYPAIVSVLAQGNAPWSSLAQAVGASQWGTSINAASGYSAAPIVTASGTITSTGYGNATGGNTATAGTCGARGGGIQLDPLKSIPLVGSIAPSVKLFNACQVKAIVGGLAVAGGALIMISGVVIFTTQMGLRSKALAQVANNPAVNFATRGVSGAVANGAKALSPRARRDERDYRRQRETIDNPSPARVEYLRNRSAAKRATSTFEPFPDEAA